MTPAQATAHLHRLAAAYDHKLTPAAQDTWTTELAQLDDGTCGTAIARTVREHERFPSVAQFHAVYRQLRTAHTAPIGQCATCEGARWLYQPDTILDGTKHQPAIHKGQMRYENATRCPTCIPQAANHRGTT